MFHVVPKGNEVDGKGACNWDVVINGAIYTSFKHPLDSLSGCFNEAAQAVDKARRADLLTQVNKLRADLKSLGLLP